MGVTAGYISITTVSRPLGDIALEAWNASRPNDLSATKAAIMNVDVPVNELEDFVLLVHAPLIIRDLFFTLRDHVAWARTSRADNIMEWDIYHAYFHTLEVKELYTEMLHRKKLGQSQDRFRSMIPLCYMTDFTVKLSARSLIKFAAGVADMIAAGLDGNVTTMLVDLHRELTRAIKNSAYGTVHPRAYGATNLMAGTFELKKNYVTGIGPWIMIGRKEVPFQLRAQIVRHRPIQFTDGLFHLFTDDGLLAPIECTLPMELMMRTDVARSLVVKRNCWIAQADIWAPIVQAINSILGAEEEPALPCTGKDTCPVAQDNLLRLGGKDPAPPCPLWCGFTKAEPAEIEATKLEMMNYAHDRKALAKWWHNQIFNVYPDKGA